jgi:uncharacterized membrane protein YdbT with pleckstrin-like domain
MSYVKRVLQPGENIKYVSRLHWIVFLPSFVLLIFGVISLLLLTLGHSSPVRLVLVSIVFALGAISLLHAWFRRWTTEIAVTDRRVIYKRGFVRRHTIEMNMDKVESVDVNQSIMGRFFGYGTITVHGTGTGIEPLEKIDSPIEFRNNVTAQ